MYDPISPQNLTTSPASLLVATLALLQRRCLRNELNAARLLYRAANSADLSLAEREVCQCLAEELER